MAAEQASSPFVALLESTQVSELVTPDREIVFVDSTQSPKDAFQKIVDAGILSAPVWDAKRNEYVGFLDTRDLVQFVVFKADEEAARSEQQSLVPPPVDLRTIFDAAARFYERAEDGITVSYLARRNRFVPVHPDESLTRVVQLLTHGSHRVPVVDRETSKVVDIISQSTVVAFLNKNLEELGPIMQATVDSVKLGSRPVIPVRTSSTALECFRVMAKYNRSGIAVVDEEGRFVGNTSGSDLKLFVRDSEANMAKLHQPIMDFLSEIRRANVGKTRTPTISVSSTSTVARVVGKLAATRVHRVFVADDAEGYKPVAVISLTDVLRYGMTVSSLVKVAVDSA